MNTNEYNINPIYGTINDIPISSGEIYLDCDHEKLYANILNREDLYDNTFNTPILEQNIVYLPEFPGDYLSYSQMLENGKQKYFWDALHQKLYKFLVQDTIQPFVLQKQVIVGVDGSPTQVVEVLTEFSKVDGDWIEVQLEEETSNYIVVHGHPSQYAERPYKENVYYYDDINDKYYIFRSYFTKNKNNWYYNKNETITSLLAYNHEQSAWYAIESAQLVNGNPNEEILISDGPTSPDKTDINEINQEIFYVNKITDELYVFSYGKYFVDINYSGQMYERPFKFYRELQTPYIDINSNTRINMKSIYYFSGNILDIKTPDSNRYYYNIKNQHYYRYNSVDNNWEEISQDNIIIPPTLFPHTNGPVNN